MADVTPDVSRVEEEPWFEWRFEQLLKAGYPPDYAYPLALDRVEVDLHRAIDLVAACGIEQAFAILH